jgi:hypothetical protein
VRDVGDETNRAEHQTRREPVKNIGEGDDGKGVDCTARHVSISIVPVLNGDGVNRKPRWLGERRRKGKMNASPAMDSMWN